MNFIKKNWKNLLLIILVICCISTCTSKGNYQRKYNKQVAYTEYVCDSMKTVYSNSSRYIDSLTNVIRERDHEISYLKKDISRLEESDKRYKKELDRTITIQTDSNGVVKSIKR